MRTTSLPRPKKRRIRSKHIVLSSLLIVVTATYSVVSIARPFAELTPNVGADTLNITTSASKVPWPSYGQAAFGLSDGTVIATNGEQAPIAMASTAKIVTALAILQKHPLAANASGPVITLNDNDVALYKNYIAIRGSVTPVYSGQRLTERQALEALLLPSANNIADSLAIWAFGSINAYLTFANDYVKNQGLTNTRLGGDASGFLPNSASTARDLVKLGAVAMSNPTIASIVGQQTASIPGVGTVKNVNTLLGSNNIVGVKTGNNDQDLGVFVGAVTTTVNGKPVTLISAIADGPSLGRVLNDSANLLAVARTTFSNTTVVHKGDVLGTYQQTDGTSLQAIAASDLKVTVLRGDSVQAKVKLHSISYNTKSGSTVGDVSVAATKFTGPERISVILKQPPSKPSISYRLLHP